MTTTNQGGPSPDMRALTIGEAEFVAGGLNPQPLPPSFLFRRDWVLLNPQPLPPRWSLFNVFRFF